MIKMYLQKLFDGIEYADTTTGAIKAVVENPWGSRVLIQHKIVDGATGGYCALTHTPDGGTTEIAHQGGNDDENPKSSNVSTGTYASVYSNVADFVVTLNVNSTAGGTHTVWACIFGDY